ncbi:MAG: FAD-dependent oxidoreductase [Micrococcales bacterium]|nr:FAD-dependent oxidoreductase [Micrococcales bacterium]
MDEALTPRRRIAVVGGGVAGLTAAYLLSRSHEVTLFEAQPRLGGHAHTHDVTDGSATHRVDSGFIVHNRVTYPHLIRLFDELGVQTRPTEMSMSVSCGGCGLEYAGGKGLGGILAQPSALARKDFRSMLVGIRRFHAEATRWLAQSEDETTTLGQWLSGHGFDDFLVRHYAMPLVACVWSSGHELALDYPARFLFRFLDNHGMLSVRHSHTWLTVVGGSATYVELLSGRLDDVRVADPVTAVSRGESVSVTTQSGATSTHDGVVIATHSDEALRLLTDATTSEREILGAIPYGRNATVLHTDESLLPETARARASWNFQMDSCDSVASAPVVTYWMNRLMGHASTRPHLVTLNSAAVDPSAVIASMDYAHPVYTAESVAARARLDELATPQTVFAGAYHGWGFHEDGCRSGVAAAEHFGVVW